MMNLLLVALGGALGASLRYGTYLAIDRYAAGGATMGTLVVNIVGSGLLGAIVAWFMARDLPGESALWMFLTVGVLGAFTTFSAFSRETVHMINTGDMTRAVIYALANVVLSVGAYLAVWHIVRRVVS
ncbi:CrcB family protein [Henriciella sp.]|uniref:fluoride efflux transporter FluC n=1 Tax=Henriciella sp. TaxID=1968823 RepID=UPI0026179226|nr:CrcB family protein [Henriciella sp.]